MSNLTEIWKNVLKDIEKEVSPGTYVAFFKHAHLLDLNDTIATIGMSNAIVISMVENRYHDLIKTFMDIHTGKDTILKFTPHIPVEDDSSETMGTGTLFTSNPIHEPASPPQRNPAGIRSDFTFDTLAVSESNRLAYEAAKAIAENPGRNLNPFYIYGPVGVGKTHLMQSIANERYRKNPSLKVIYITSEDFNNQVIESIGRKTTVDMRNKFRKPNLLIIDDIQFFSNKKVVQEELFHTFNALIANNAQIVLSSDKPPSEIQGLEDRLSSRFAGGLTVDIQAPDFELRTAILLKKAEKMHVDLSIEAAKVLSEKEQDVRSLEGTLMRAVIEAKAKGVDINELILRNHVPAAPIQQGIERLHAEDVIKTVCEYYNIKATAIKGDKRNASIVKARQIIMFILKSELRLTYVEIGNLLGGRDHTTIMHGVEKMQGSMLKNTTPSEDIVGITKMLRG